MENVIAAAYIAVSLAIGLVAREYARARTADTLGDPSPRRWGWLSLRPRAWVDPFGTVILPTLIVILWAAGVQPAGIPPPPFAYAKPPPLDPSMLRRQPRDVVVVSIAGPAVNVLLAFVGAVVLRFGLGQAAFEPCRAVALFTLTNLSLAIFHLLPVPGLDGARMLALVMPPRPREVYRNLEHYLILFILLIYFLLGPFTLSIVNALTTALLNLMVGSSAC